jgi:hypothetical protein
MNGIPRQPGPMPNGVGSGQGQMQPTFPMAAPTQQPNGIPGGGPSVPGAPLQAPFQPLPPGQRPPLGPQQRVPNGMPFQSPTMAHSPSGGASQHGQTPMGLGPSPHLAHMNRGGMLPPNSMQVMNNLGATQMNTPTQSFQQIGRLPSPSVADGQNHHMKPSPSFAARLPPGGMQPGGDMREPNITHELHRLPPATLVSAKQEAGVAEKDITAYTLEEKVIFKHVLRSDEKSYNVLATHSHGGKGTSKSQCQAHATRFKQCCCRAIRIQSVHAASSSTQSAADATATWEQTK